MNVRLAVGVSLLALGIAIPSFAMSLVALSNHQAREQVSCNSVKFGSQ